ncbi:hypothetical protein NE237_008587 [Protea cynaroides]|uniref:Uncharacterized protein n=1 Tax=Protea cynaroides TaxID=273540 RepID=A0A9Q0KW56_9MAGN|nr:hypothetical protein NE237_008587 [Protea cynaroides]
MCGSEDVERYFPLKSGDEPTHLFVPYSGGIPLGSQCSGAHVFLCYPSISWVYGISYCRDYLRENQGFQWEERKKEWRRRLMVSSWVFSSIIESQRRKIENKGELVLAIESQHLAYGLGSSLLNSVFDIPKYDGEREREDDPRFAYTHESLDHIPWKSIALAFFLLSLQDQLEM